MRMATKQSTGKGFTLLESLIAIAILTVGVSAAMLVIVSSLNVGTRTKHKIVAANLAQEGIEVVRSIRDRNWFAGRAWTDGILNLNNACVQWDSAYNSVNPTCSGGSNLILFGTPPHYVHSTNLAQFSRVVGTRFFPADTPNLGDSERLQVTATTTCGANCTITLEEYLYDWK